MDKKNIVKSLEISDLPKDSILYDIASESEEGLNVVKYLFARFDNTQIYVPKLQNCTPLVNRFVDERYRQGAADFRIARELNIGVRTVARIIKQIKSKADSYKY